MKITLITVGKLKERYLEAAVQEYSKRLRRYCDLEICQVADEKTPDGAGRAMEEQILEKEGGRILEKIRPHSYVIWRSRARCLVQRLWPQSWKNWA